MRNIDWLREPPDVAPPVGPPFAVDNEDWRATIERVEVTPSIHVFLTDAKVHRDLRVEPATSRTDAYLCGQFAVAGGAGMEFDGALAVRLDPETALLFRMPVKPRTVYSLAAGSRFVAAGYTLTIETAGRLLGGEVPPAFEPLLQREVEHTYCFAAPTGRAVRALATSLFSPGLNGPLRRLMMEGAVLQLFALQSARLARRSLPRLASPQLSETEQDALIEARRLLLADMREPPTLGQLAQAVGLSEKRLNAGFRRQFGGTVFEVLRGERLEHARLAFEAGGISVKEAAWRVGYNHVTNFINAFRLRYGAPPIKFVKRQDRPTRRRRAYQT